MNAKVFLQRNIPVIAAGSGDHEWPGGAIGKICRQRKRSRVEPLVDRVRSVIGADTGRIGEAAVLRVGHISDIPDVNGRAVGYGQNATRLPTAGDFVKDSRIPPPEWQLIEYRRDKPPADVEVG